MYLKLLSLCSVVWIIKEITETSWNVCYVTFSSPVLLLVTPRWELGHGVLVLWSCGAWHGRSFHGRNSAWAVLCDGLVGIYLPNTMWVCKDSSFGRDFWGKKDSPSASPGRMCEIPSLPCETIMRSDPKETGAILYYFNVVGLSHSATRSYARQTNWGEAGMWQ